LFQRTKSSYGDNTFVTEEMSPIHNGGTRLGPNSRLVVGVQEASLAGRYFRHKNQNAACRLPEEPLMLHNSGIALSPKVPKVRIAQTSWLRWCHRRKRLLAQTLHFFVRTLSSVDSAVGISGKRCEWDSNQGTFK
jgi:hypothetical protein